MKFDTHSRCCLCITGWGNALEGGKKKSGKRVLSEWGSSAAV